MLSRLQRSKYKNKFHLQNILRTLFTDKDTVKYFFVVVENFNNQLKRGRVNGVQEGDWKLMYQSTLQGLSYLILILPSYNIVHIFLVHSIYIFLFVSK